MWHLSRQVQLYHVRKRQACVLESTNKRFLSKKIPLPTYYIFFFRIENANVEHIMCSECVTRCWILPKRDKSRIFSLYFWKYWRRNCSISDWWDFVLFFTTSLWNNRQNHIMCLSSFSPFISKKNFRNKISSWMDLAKSCSAGFLRLDKLWNFLCQRLWKKWIWRN